MRLRASGEARDMSGLWKQIGAVALAWLAACCAQAAAVPVSPSRIVAVGDLHGDFSVWRDIARAAGLIDDAGHWSGGRTVLVQTGDVVDRGPESLKIILDLMQLQKEAPRVGGQVVTLVGNHEAMNVTDDLRYVSAGDYAAFADANSAATQDAVFEASKAAITAAYRTRDPSITDAGVRQAFDAATPLGMIEHQRAWHPDGRIGRWVARNPAVVLIGGTLFVHGGISAAYARLPIAEINRRIDEALAAKDTAPDSIISDPLGPLWYRGLVTRSDPDDEAARSQSTSGVAAPTIEQELDQVLTAYGAQRIVIAHTPILSGIQISHDGKLIRIDTGISAYYGGTPSYLEILGNRVVPHAVPRSQPINKGTQ